MDEDFKDIRWRQRFQNLRRANALLAEAAGADSLSRLEQEGMIQRFEYSFELAWKTMKDYLEAKGLSQAYPRDVIKSAFATELISDGDLWLEMLERRNILSHTYEEKAFSEAVRLVRGGYSAAIADLVERLEREP